jgi:hypothetical protein
MLRLNSPTTELTTAATDALLGLLCIFLIAAIRKFRTHNVWKTGLWSWVFGLLGLASFLGAVAHGFDLSPARRNLLWQPLYLALGIAVALFIAGSVYDRHGQKAARRLVPVALATGAAFYSLSLFLDGSFWVFVIYEGAAMLTALAIYVSIAIRRQIPGAGTISAGIGLTMVAAALQAGTLHFTFIWPFDHNGIFHTVQIVALLILGCGLRASLAKK